jgi:hypothetical protein
MRSNNPSVPQRVDIVSGNIFSESGTIIVVLQYVLASLNDKSFKIEQDYLR